MGCIIWINVVHHNINRFVFCLTYRNILIIQFYNIRIMGLVFHGIDLVMRIKIEDPDDGYRSHCKELEVCNEVVSNNFPAQKVMGKMKDNDTYSVNDTIQFIDVVTGKVVLEVGTDNTDDYYPYCVMNWSPENLACNVGR